MLRTLGTLYLPGFSRIKPLLLLAFVALEGQTPRRRVAELLWPGAEQPDVSLRTTLYRLRSHGVLFDSEEPLQTSVACDAVTLLAKRGLEAVECYGGAFLGSVDLKDVSAEFEDWVLLQRERLARHVQAEGLSYAEGCDPAEAAQLAEQLYRLPGAALAEAELLRRLLALSLPGSALEQALQAELQECPEVPPVLAPAARREKRRLLGRSLELDTLLAWAAQSGDGVAGGRLASISGPGGVGKSTLAYELLRELHRLGHSVLHVDAEGVAYFSDLLARIIAQAGSAQAGSGRTVPGTWVGVGKLLAERPVVLLDGLDALEETAEIMNQAVRALPQVRWVVTARRSPWGLPTRKGGSLTQRGYVRQTDDLNVFSMRLSGLDFPDPDADLSDIQDSAAVRLFVREGQRSRRNFDFTPAQAGLLSSLTRRLQGHPLALALAASWLRVEGLEQVHARVLEQAATLEDAYSPQRSLTLVAQRSWDMLDAAEQQALLRLSFCNDFDPAHAAALGIGERELDALLEHSFLELFRPGSERLRLCPALASVSLTYGPHHQALLDEARAQHAHHYLEWFTARPPTAPEIADERENIRYALYTALDAGGCPAVPPDEPL